MIVVASNSLAKRSSIGESESSKERLNENETKG